MQLNQLHDLPDDEPVSDDTDEFNPLEILLANGWHDATQELPEGDMTVQVAWDDYSTSPRALAFCDSISGREEEGRKWWSKSMNLLSDGSVTAWKEITS